MLNLLKITEMVSVLPGVCYATRQAVHKPTLVNKTKRAIQKAFENQRDNKGTSIVEVLSNCNSGWKMTPVDSNIWLDENMTKYFPLGDIKK